MEAIHQLRSEQVVVYQQSNKMEKNGMIFWDDVETVCSTSLSFFKLMQLNRNSANSTKSARVLQSKNQLPVGFRRVQ